MQRASSFPNHFHLQEFPDFISHRDHFRDGTACVKGHPRPVRQQSAEHEFFTRAIQRLELEILDRTKCRDSHPILAHHAGFAVKRQLLPNSEHSKTSEKGWSEKDRKEEKRVLPPTSNFHGVALPSDAETGMKSPDPKKV